MIRRPPRSTLDRSSAASDVYKRQELDERQAKDEDEEHPGNGRRIALAEVLEAAAVEVCLLYTSPSPRDRTRTRMPSSA